MRKFSSIDQFRHVVDSVERTATYVGLDYSGEAIYASTKQKPVLTFTGTTKLHGTNAGIEFDLEQGTVNAQSREQMLSIGNDNAGFCAWLHSPEGKSASTALRRIIDVTSKVTGSLYYHVFGEWVGQGVNGKTAIGQLSKRFVVFGVVVSTTLGTEDAPAVEQWLDIKELAKAYRVMFPRAMDFYFITDYKQWELKIDFNDPGASLADLERLTLEVEAQCPVALAMGVDGMGEGIVWTCHDDKFGRLAFKTKGEKHKGTKNKQLVQIAPEIIEGVNAFVDAVLTESRLEQGFDLLQSQHGKVTLDHIGDFLKWVGQDVVKEESDSLKASDLDGKMVMKAVNKAAKNWVMPKLAKF